MVNKKQKLCTEAPWLELKVTTNSVRRIYLLFLQEAYVEQWYHNTVYRPSVQSKCIIKHVTTEYSNDGNPS